LADIPLASVPHRAQIEPSSVVERPAHDDAAAGIAYALTEAMDRRALRATAEELISYSDAARRGPAQLVETDFGLELEGGAG